MEKTTNGEKDLFVGIDVGSNFVHYTVLGSARQILHCPKPIMHFANPIGAIQEAWRDITEHFDVTRIKNTAFTGSGAESFPKVMKTITYVYDSVAIPKGAQLIDPYAEYIFHIGAKPGPVLLHRNLQKRHLNI